MQYLEKVSGMHKQASNNDLFVFMYGFLSSVLIGVSAYMVKKGQTQLETFTKKYVDLDKTADKIEERLNTHEKSIQTQLETFTKKCVDLDKTADKIEQRLNIHENSIHLNVISQILSETLMSILSYNISLGNANLTRFRQSLRDVSDLLYKSSKFSERDETAAITFERTLKTIEGVYASAANKEGSEIDSTHQGYIKDEFRKIREALTNKHSKV
jgi:hypothetical protein